MEDNANNNLVKRDTTFVNVELHEEDTGAIVEKVCQALKERGYNPINQIVGYIMSGDPTYIASHNQARALITKIERDELLEYFVAGYLSKTDLRN